MKLKMYKVTFKKVLDRTGILDQVAAKNLVSIQDSITHDRHALRCTYKCHVTTTVLVENESLLKEKVVETLRLNSTRKSELLKVIKVTYKVIADNTYLLKN